MNTASRRQNFRPDRTRGTFIRRSACLPAALLAAALTLLAAAPAAAQTTQIGFAATAYSVDEGSTVYLTVNITPPLATDSSVTVNSAASSSASGEDYQLFTAESGVSVTLVLPASATTTTFNLSAVADDVTEGVETAVLELIPIGSPPYQVAASARQATVTIADTSLTPTTAVWSATMTPAAFSDDGGGVGCASSVECNAQLSDNSFSVASTQYVFVRLAEYVNANGFLITLSEAPNAVLQSLKFCVGTTAYTIGSASLQTLTPRPNPSWTAGTQVALSIAPSCPNAATFTNTDLSGLEAKSSTDGTTFTALTLAPAFSTSTTAYTASVDNAVTHLQLTPTTAHGGATLRVGKSGSLASLASGTDSSAIPLDVGANTVLVEVTAEDRIAKNTYTVSVTRAPGSLSSNADLSALTAKRSTDGNTFTALSLTPSFSAATTAYRASVANDVTQAILTPTTARSGAAILVGKSGSLAAVSSGSDSTAVALTEGANAVLVEVTAEDATTKIYTVTITRAQPPTTLTLEANTTNIPKGTETEITAMLNNPALSGGSVVTLTIVDANGDMAATEGDDYSLTTKTFTIAAGRRSEKVTLTTIADAEASEGKTITISAASTNPTLSTGTPLVLTIVSQLQTERLHQTALPEVARAVAGRVTGAISTRVGQVLNGSGSATASANLGGQSSLAGALKTHAPGLINENRPLRDLLHGSRFVLPFHRGGGGDGGLSAMSLWGSGEYRNLSGENDGLEFDGTLHGAQIGVDSKLRENLLAGVALSWSQGEFDYQDTGEGGGGQGDYEIDIQALHPYLGWRTAQLSWWATAGFGSGEVEITPEGSTATSSDVNLRSIGTGGSGLLWSNADNTASVRLKGEFTQTEMEVEKSEQTAALTVDATLMRLAAEASRTRNLTNGGHLHPTLSLGMRHDGGDGHTGAGAEITTGVRYTNPQTGITASATAHSLVGRNDYEEWGIQATLRNSPGADGQGLSFVMKPGYGNGGSGNTGQIWSNGLRGDTSAATRDPSGRLEIRLGYGLSTPGERNGLLTPWSGLTLQENGKLYRLGVDWDSGGSFPFTLRLHGERRENENADADHAVLLKGETRF